MCGAFQPGNDSPVLGAFSFALGRLAQRQLDSSDQGQITIMKLTLPSWGSALVCCFLAVSSHSWWSKEAQAGTDGIARLDTGDLDARGGDVGRAGDPPPFAASLGSLDFDASGKSPELPMH